MARKNLLASLADAEPVELPSEPRVRAEPFVNLNHRGGALAEITRSVEQARGNAVIEINPDIIDPSIVEDRLEVDDEEQRSLTRAIQDQGQLIPVLVRPHPISVGRYQIAYGRRRLAAARELNRPVKAVVRALTDDELVVAQGQENNERKNLSYLERSLFAGKLEERGFSRDIIMSAAGVDKTTLSKMISIATRIPREILFAIGPAPRAGRDRWAELMSALESRPEATKLVRDLIAQKGFPIRNSDDRFAAALKAASSRAKKNTVRSFVNSYAGSRLICVDADESRVRVTVDRRVDAQFADYLVAELSELYNRFRHRAEAPS
jgi:ParB family transcriptional regulator, chromosome partitioning protein